MDRTAPRLRAVLALCLLRTAAAAFCPIEIDPPAVVVKYGDPVSANCTVTRTTRGMGWEASVGSIDMQMGPQSLLWSASSLTDWTAEPKCYANFQTEPKQCEKKLSILLYKYPDSVSISSVGHTGPMEVGGQYQLQCDVQSIAPVQYLSVKWYRGGALIHTENLSEDTTRTPVNVYTAHLITPSCTDDGVQYTCEAELRLGPEGPQANPVMKSEPLSVTVHCRSRTTFWTILVTGIALAALLLIGYVILKRRAGKNSII
ncbi:intercellular adhesion molecule 3 [Amia ocellicauda]|uniref:intercellular adhesion molecule 3 n=1 Tax=Amia ocellicauda TaxID=2972642 RepID=UPI0034649873